MPRETVPCREYLRAVRMKTLNKSDDNKNIESSRNEESSWSRSHEETLPDLFRLEKRLDLHFVFAINANTAEAVLTFHSTSRSIRKQGTRSSTRLESVQVYAFHSNARVHFSNIDDPQAKAKWAPLCRRFLPVRPPACPLARPSNCWRLLG